MPGRIARLLLGLRLLAWALAAALGLCLPANGTEAPPDGIPRRVVSLDWGLAETLLELGVVPLGLPETDAYRRWVGGTALPEQVVDVGLRVEPNLELLRHLAPDLILIISEQEELRPLLERIAPTLALSTFTGRGTPYEEAASATRRLGDVLGKAREAQALLDRAERSFAEARARLAADASAPPVFLVTFMDPRHVRVFGTGSLPGEVLSRIGLRNAWTGEANFWGFATMGIEHLASAPQASLVHIEPTPQGVRERLNASPLWRRLDFVERSDIHALPPTLVFGMIPSAERFARLLAQLPLGRGTAAHD